MPMPINESQKAVLLANVDRVQAFLESEDGSDAMELFVLAFAEFCEPKQVTEPAADYKFT
jgi:hypothetical protein